MNDNKFVWYSECTNTGKLELLWGLPTPVTSILLPNKQLVCFRNHRYARVKHSDNVARHVDYNLSLFYQMHCARREIMHLVFRYSNNDGGPYRVRAKCLNGLDNKLFLTDSSTMSGQCYYIVITWINTAQLLYRNHQFSYCFVNKNEWIYLDTWTQQHN